VWLTKLCIEDDAVGWFLIYSSRSTFTYTSCAPQMVTRSQSSSSTERPVSNSRSRSPPHDRSIPSETSARSVTPRTTPVVTGSAAPSSSTRTLAQYSESQAALREAIIREVRLDITAAQTQREASLGPNALSFAPESAEDQASRRRFADALMELIVDLTLERIRSVDGSEAEPEPENQPDPHLQG